ncbi:hypothetical protein Bbelb_078020 [Branchiostoma belcheri]|nr:hypothetical protein Bbelb_078020 [Branchiostoma belcheri]
MWSLQHHYRDFFSTHRNWREKLGRKLRNAAMWSGQAGKTQEIIITTTKTYTEEEKTVQVKRRGSMEHRVPSIEPYSSERPSNSIEPASIEPSSTEPPSIEPHSIEPDSIEPQFEIEEETTRREPLWTEAEMERFWAVVEPHVRRLSSGEAAVPVCTVELADPKRGLTVSDLRFCLWDLQELIWAGRYSQALAGVRTVRELLDMAGEEDGEMMVLFKEKDEVELFKKLFMKLEPVRRRQMNNFKQVTFGPAPCS